MCFRVFQNPDSAKDWKRFLDLGSLPLPLDFPKSEAYPLGQVAAIRSKEGSLESFVGQFGLLPPFAEEKTFGRYTYNARSETIFEKASFKHTIKKRRCLIPVNYFYEWAEKGKEKILYRIKRKAEGLFIFGGIWETSKRLNQESLAIVTTPPNPLIEKVGHDRSPLILDKENLQAWLTASEKEIDSIRAIIQTYKGKDIEIEEVERRPIKK